MRVRPSIMLGTMLSLFSVALFLAGCAPKPSRTPQLSPGSTTTVEEVDVVEEEAIPAGGQEAVEESAMPEEEPSAEAAAMPEEAVAEPAGEAKPDEPLTPAPSEPETPAPAPVEPAPAEPAAAAETQAAGPTVLLGSPELTAGIPGEGPLSVEQIQAWLANADNHVTLNVVLPLGLSAGQSAIKGLDTNPLTRAKIELGRQLYFDPRLSVDGTVSCGDCHHVDEGWSRRTQFGVGIGGLTGNRNSPVSYNRILSDAQFWDGRAGSLEEQAIGPIANPIEMGNSHEEVVAMLKENEGYRLQFEKIFSDGVTIENVGRALASFERAVVTGPSPYDYFEQVRSMREALRDLLDDLEALKEEDPDLYAKYTAAVAASEANPMSENAQRGREIFFTAKGGCSACHVGPNLTDEKYHNLGVGMDKPEPDLGRFAVTSEEKDRGAFKTPTIRNVALSAPYMHDGSQATLEEVVDWYVQGGHPNPYLSSDMKTLALTDQDKADLVAFMQACTGEFPQIETGRLPQ